MKKFSTSLNGYNKREVNSFVTEVAQEYESMLTNLKKRDEDISNLKQRLIQYQNMENTLNKALMVVEDASNQIKRMARDESKSIIDEAKRNSSRIVNDALLKAQKLETDGEELKRRIIVFKRKFKAIIETELEVMETLDEDL